MGITLTHGSILVRNDDSNDFHKRTMTLLSYVFKCVHPNIDDVMQKSITRHGVGVVWKADRVAPLAEIHDASLEME